jgi:ferric-dicitrate binding protein FerR (iron transport regulator)
VPAPRPDEHPRAVRRSSERLDPSFLRKLEDDSLWQTSTDGRPQRARPPRREKRSRLVAIIALVAVALVFLIIGLTVGTSDSGSPGGKSSPFRLLPLPSTAVTSMVSEASVLLL